MDSSDETASDTLIKRAGSPITKKGYRKGRSPANKGKKLAPQALTPDELDRVMQSFGRTKVGARNRAMVALMARLGLKVGQVVRLQHDHYHAGGNALLVPGIQGGADRPVAVDVVTRQILDAWVEYRDVLKPGALAPFFYTVSDGHVGEEIDPGYVRDVVRNHVKKCGIRKRVSPEGLRKTFQDQASDRSRQVALDIVAYVEDEPFRRRYPGAHAKWRAAVDLYNADGVRHASAIGIHCRESMGHFATELCTLHGVRSATNVRPTDKIRDVIRVTPGLDPEVLRVLDALVALWLAIHDLVNRQVHGNERGAGALNADDSLRVVFQTMLVMFELDRAIGAPA